MAPERTVHYADSGGFQIAYEVLGDGPLDIVSAFEHGSNIDLVHEHPMLDRFLRGFGAYGRLIHVDLRGVGLSDAMEQVPPLEDWVDDIRSVMAAVGSERAALIGHGYGSQLVMLFAAMHPNETSALVTINGYARLRRAPDYPWGMPPETERGLLAFMRDGWGTGSVLGSFNPGMKEGPRDWLSRLERSSATPRRSVRRQKIALEIDVRDVLPAIAVPTLIVQSESDPYIRRGHAQYLVEHIADARYVGLDSDDHTPTASHHHSAVLMETIEEFLTGTKQRTSTDRVLKTVAFTDVVESTRRAAELGDRRWRSLLETLESVSRREVESARGQLLKFTGDGLMATFDGPARAVQCVKTIGDLLEPDLPIRAGVHTGEVEIIGDDIGGIAVHVAARIAALAGAGEVLTSSTVRDLVAGSGIVFEDRGEQALKGVPEPWRIFSAS